MNVRVRVPTALRDLCGDESTLVVDLHEPATVADLLDAIAGAHPALERRIRDEQGMLRTHVNVFVGEDNVRDLEGLATGVGAGGEISVLAAISGG